jgi:hypothetical protein
MAVYIIHCQKKADGQCHEKQCSVFEVIKNAYDANVNLEKMEVYIPVTLTQMGLNLIIDQAKEVINCEISLNLKF